MAVTWRGVVKRHGEWSEYVPGPDFTTTQYCYNVEGIEFTTIYTTPATVEWQPHADASRYRVKWKPVSGTTWRSRVVNPPATSAILTNLTPNTEYDVWFITTCTWGAINDQVTDYFATPAFRLSDESTDLNFSIFPNPSSGAINIEALVQSDENAQVKVVDLSGRVLMERNWSLADNEWLSFNSGLSAGIYIIQISVKEQSWIERLVVTEQ